MQSRTQREGTGLHGNALFLQKTGHELHFFQKLTN